jgi:hypothetical protein
LKNNKSGRIKLHLYHHDNFATKKLFHHVFIHEEDKQKIRPRWILITWSQGYLPPHTNGSFVLPNIDLYLDVCVLCERDHIRCCQSQPEISNRIGQHTHLSKRISRLCFIFFFFENNFDALMLHLIQWDCSQQESSSLSTVAAPLSFMQLEFISDAETKDQPFCSVALGTCTVVFFANCVMLVRKFLEVVNQSIYDGLVRSIVNFYIYIFCCCSFKQL